MPGIPDAPMTSVDPQVQQGGMLSEVASPDMYGANVGQATAQMGEVESRIYHDANASAVTAARNKVDAAAQEKLYNPKTGLLYQNYGERAAPEVDKVAQAYKENVSETRDALTNDDQRAMFDKAMGEHGLQYQRTLGEYEHKQVTNGQNANTAAFIQNRQNDIAQNYHDPLFAHASIGMIRDSLIEAYARNNAMDPLAAQKQVANGTEPEELKEALLKADSGSHMLVINTAMANEQNGYARTYFEANKHQLTATDLAKATSMVRTSALHDEARATADEIIAQNKDRTNLLGEEDPNAPPVSLESQLAELEKRKIEDTQLHDLIESRLIHHNDLEKKAHTEQQTNLLEQASDQMDGSPNFDVTSDVLGQLDFKHKNAVETYQKKMRKYGRIETDEDVKLNLRTMASDPNSWDDFIKEDLSIYKGSLNNVDYEKARTLQATIKGQVAKRDMKLSQFQVSDQVATAILNENGLVLPKSVNKDSDTFREYAAQRNRFMDQLNRAVQTKSLDAKKELTEPEIKEEAQKLFIQTTWQKAPQTWWEKVTNAPAGQAIPGLNFGAVGTNSSMSVTGPEFMSPGADKIAYRIDDIPAETLRIMKENDKKAGATRSNARLIESYNKNVVKAARTQATNVPP